MDSCTTDTPTEFEDPWEQDTSGDHISAGMESRNNETDESEHEEGEASAKSLFEEYGTNEPYAEPENTKRYWNHDIFFELLTGPSTNFYVGPQGKHYTIPKRLLYYFSDYAKVCLEGSFSEATANAVWLPDVDPKVFQWLWQWLYSGELKVLRYYYFCQGGNVGWRERLPKACQVLCRLYILGERLLFDYRFLDDGVRKQLEEVIEEAKTKEEPMPLTPEVVEDVLSDSAPVRYGHFYWGDQSLRRFMLIQLCTFQFCTTVDFMHYVDCFEKDGGFPAEIMRFVAGEIKWAVDRWGMQIESPVDVPQREEYYAEEEGISQWVATGPKTRKGVWLALRYMCTFAGSQTTDFRAYSQCFELEGAFAAELLNYMAEKLLWIVARWGEEREEEVDVAAEKEEEEWIAQEESDRQHMVDKYMRRQGWT